MPFRRREVNQERADRVGLRVMEVIKFRHGEPLRRF
jgi:hypothetical protein